MSVHLRASYAGEGSEVMSKSGNSRLETMKRQFNKKMGRRTLPTPQKINAASKMSPASETAQNDERLQKDSSHSNSSNSNAAPSTFNQSGAVIMRRPIRKELPTGVHRQSNRRKSAEAKLSESSKEEASSLAAQSNKKESGHKSLRALDRRTPVQSRHNQPKPRAIQMQMATSSARQVLENVLTREMRGVYVPRKRNDTAQSTEENIPDENLEGSTSTNDPQVLEEGPISPVPPSKESSNNQRSPFAGHSGLLPPGHVGNANIREKLRQHYRHNTAASKSEATKVQDNPTQESFTGESSSTAERNHPSTSNTNETILNKIRQKGPVVAKQMGSQSMEELENLAASPKKKKIPSQAKPSSRPGSPRTPRRRGSPITTGRTSPYAKRVGSPTSRGISRGRNPSPKGRNPSPNRRPPSPNTDGISPYSPDVTSKKISRVLKARLYLLQQNGPNSFRIGGDSPEHKYLVIVGPQTCNCGRGQFCVHVLFVMLRVFQLDSSSNLLWRRTLKNYEVESLFKSYHERCNNRISPKKKSRVQRLVSHLASGADKHPDASSNSDDQSSSKGEEESCPICLLQMVDGESVTVCEVGCRNRLHTHCVNIWAEECRRNGGPLKCPLCRVIWKPAETTRGSGLGPLMVEIPQEYAEMADAWIQEFGWEMVSCLFSSHPNVRENALRRLSHDITGALLTNIQITSSSTEVGGHRSDDSDSSSSGVHTNHPSSSVANNPSIACCCAILAMVCSDPEYRVYITALRTLRAMMAYTQCRTTDDVTAFQNLLTPVIESILFKCADSNRRTVQLSVSTVMELCRGQTGELAVGKEIVSDDTLGVGDVDYLLSFLNFGNSPDSSSWQWMLGRLNAVGELFREFKRFLNPGVASSSEASDSSEGSRRLIKIANFAASCLSNTTQPRVGKIARRVFLQSYSFALSNPLVAARLESIVSEMEPESSQRLRRKIKSVKAMTSGQEVTEMPSASRDDRCDPNHSHSDDNFADNEVLDIHSPQQGTYPYLHNYPTSLVQPTPPTYPAPHRWYSPQRQSAPSSVPHYPTFGVNSWRGSLPVGQYTNVAPNSSVMWGNCEGETQATNHHPPSPCMGTHPPTPPPSSMDTANLDAAIEVSLFRPIRSMSPDPTPDEAGKVIAQFTNIPEQPPLSPPEQWNAEEEPVTRATNSDKVRRIRAKGGLNLPVTSKSEPVTPVSGSLLISPTKSEKPKRPSLLRLKSDSSAFRETQQRKVFRNSADLGAARESSRDRSSSRESSTSSTSCCEDFRRTSDRRMSVRELAESINRKQHRQDSSMKTNSSSSSSNSAPRKLPQPKRYDKQKSSGSGSILQEKQAWKSDTDDVVAHGRPLALKGAIERRGTVERYRDGLKHGHPPSSHPRKIREDNGRKMDEVRESGDLHISPFVGSSGSGRIPTRGILKNSGIPGPFTPSVTSVSTASEMVASATDSGFITDTNHFSDNSQAKSRKILSPESESPQEDIGHFDHVRDSISKMRLDDSLISPSEHSSASQRIPRRSGLPSSSGSRKPRALLNYHKQKSASLPRDPPLQDDPDSPTMTRSVEMEAPSTSASNEFNRCPSAPAATLLRAGEESSQNLPPNEEEGPEEISTASDITWSASESLSSSNVRRRGHPRKLPARPNRLSRRKGRDKLKKQVSPRLSSSVEDLLAESDHSLAEKTPVTFKSEIGVQTPGSFPHEDDPGTTASSNGHRLSAAPSVEGYEADLEVHCSCRMQIAEEEDKMFAHTLAVSYVQDALPLVPHLSFDDAEGDIVRVQSEHTSVEREYKENKQWSKGAQIGLGAFSACFQARDMFTGTLMAVKQVNYIRCSQLEQQQVLAVITEEIALMRNLNHPNIVRLHGVTKEGPLYNVFIEWCAGGSVSALLSHYGSFNEAVIANYALQLFRGLAYIHDQHLIHRDIKGANLLIDSTGQRLRISDFGAAARLASKGTGAGEFQGQLLGTIAFMAPEVLRGEQYGRSCDVWSCGCVVTEMATGKPPWEADMHSNHLALIFKIASSPTVPPIPDVLSPAMRDLCRRCLQTNPRDRPTASELLKHPVFIRW